MEWINEYKGQKVHPGQQPVRILIHNVIESFEHVYRDFKKDAKSFYDDFGLEPGIPYFIGPLPLVGHGLYDMTPFIMSKKAGEKSIMLSETFFSYLWGITYTIFAYFHECMYIPSGERTYTKIDFKALNKASMLFNYSYSLIFNYTFWNKRMLPNPELYKEHEKHFIGAVNHSFTRATTLILCHEVSHATKGHLEPGNKRSVLEAEIEADETAFEMIIKGITDNDSKLNAAIGTIAGLCALMFFGDTLSGYDHPDTDERVLAFVKNLHLDNNDALWGIPCIAYRLWDIVNNKDFDYGDGQGTYKDLFDSLYKQERAKR